MDDYSYYSDWSTGTSEAQGAASGALPSPLPPPGSPLPPPPGSPLPPTSSELPPAYDDVISDAACVLAVAQAVNNTQSTALPPYHDFARSTHAALLSSSSERGCSYDSETASLSEASSSTDRSGLSARVTRHLQRVQRERRQARQSVIYNAPRVPPPRGTYCQVLGFSFSGVVMSDRRIAEKSCWNRASHRNGHRLWPGMPRGVLGTMGVKNAVPSRWLCV